MDRYKYKGKSNIHLYPLYTKIQVFSVLGFSINCFLELYA